MPVRSFISEGVVAGFIEPNTDGDVFDIDAPRNAPAKYPTQHLDLLSFHIDFGAFELVAIDLNVTINHASVAGVAGNQAGPPSILPGSLSNVTITRVGQVVSEDHLLLTHGLGFVPFYLIVYAGNVIPNGMPIQIDATSRIRLVEAYATATEIRLWGNGFSDASALSAASRTYGVMVFDRPAADIGLPLFGKTVDGVQMGRGRLNSAKKRLRLVDAGETPYGFTVTPATDWHNGGNRIYSAAGTAYTIGGYGGSMAAPTIIQVGVQ
jgi:hypothetical protein